MSKRSLASLLLAASLTLVMFSSATAQNPIADEPASVQQNAKDVLSDRAQPPDSSESDLPAGIVQGNNAGMASHDVPDQGQNRNQTPPPAGWPGSRHANRGDGPVTSINAGSIWVNADAQGKCPKVCSNKQLGWTGDWRTVGFNKSVCDCAPIAQSRTASGGPGTYCEAPPNYQCIGCLVHCPAKMIAHCTPGDRGIFNKPDATLCATEAKCECR